jgi:hypothetical protein
MVIDEPPDSVLYSACLAAVREQMAYVARQHLPWGISESAYAGCDHTLAYQYAPQGVPRLALRRTPPNELVIAPYATALAAQIAPHDACLNLSALERLGARALALLRGGARPLLKRGRDDARGRPPVTEASRDRRHASPPMAHDTTDIGVPHATLP